jgi:DNA-binding transcriptional regulator YdaS (Cro superfamily)
MPHALKINLSRIRRQGRLATMDNGLKAAIEAAGGVRRLAHKLGITHQAIVQWQRIPIERLLDIERVTGIPREKLRPELYRKR